MSKQAESRLSSNIMKELRKRGVFCFKKWGNEYEMAGLPDIIACVVGEFVTFETKMPGEEDNVSEVQQLRHKEIRAAGGRVYVVNSAAQAVRALDEVKRFHNR